MNWALALTYARIILVPVVIYLMYLPNLSLVVATLFAAISITDWLDGYVARKYDLISDLGKFLDPLADKILVISVLIVMAVQSRIDIFTFSVLILISREFAIMGFRAIAAGKGSIIAASKLAKWKTALQMIALFLMLAEWPFGIELYYLSFLIAVVSLMEYFWNNRDVLKG